MKPVAVLLCLLLGFPLAARAEDEYAAALAASERWDYARALELYRIAAEQGNRDAQRIAGLMLHYGEALYGNQVRQDRAQAKRYINLAAAQGCLVSRFVLAKEAKLPPPSLDDR